MNIYVPDYYKDFKCIAGLCKHNCCIGWEIDIDEDTYEKYEAVCGDFGKKLHAGISTDGEPHFCLIENERCPFLNKDNLCDIIINLGEDYLCQICDDHPRFRNFFRDREEIGLGLCCEAAAELILTREKKTELIMLDGDGEILDEDEACFFAKRNKAFEILQNRNLSVDNRIKQLTDEFELSIPHFTFAKWADILRSMERLDSAWDEYINKLGKLNDIPNDKFSSSKWEIIREQLLVYFVYRHMADGMYEDNICERLAFAIISEMLITAICAATSENPTEIARLYSSEIEYSEENIDEMLNICNAL